MAATAAASAVAAQHEAAADSARYRQMRQALADFDASMVARVVGLTKPAAAAAPLVGPQAPPQPLPPPRHRALYAALRGVLAQCVAEGDAASRHARLTAAHKWFTVRRPRDQPADMDAAAAMAASLSAMAVSGGDDPDQQRQPTAHGERGTSGSGKTGHGRRAVGIGSGGGGRQSASCTAGRARHLTGFRRSGSSSSGSSSGADSLDDECAAACEDAPSNPSSSPPPHQKLYVQQPSIGRQPAIKPPQPTMAPPLVASQPDLFANISLFMCGDPTGAANGAAGSLRAAREFGHRGSIGQWESAAGQSSGQTLQLQQDPRPAVAQQLRAGWLVASRDRGRVEADVARRMAGYARHRARIEEEVMRRQEVRRVLQQRGAGVAEGKEQRAQQQQRRALAHLDSQHHPPSTSAYAAARAPGPAQRLVASDSWVRRARRNAMAEGWREVAAAAAALLGAPPAAGARGGPAQPAESRGEAGALVVEALAHALLPLPDQPHLSVSLVLLVARLGWVWCELHSA
jgi:hypothetical protein